MPSLSLIFCIMCVTSGASGLHGLDHATWATSDCATCAAAADETSLMQMQSFARGLSRKTRLGDAPVNPDGFHREFALDYTMASVNGTVERARASSDAVRARMPKVVTAAEYAHQTPCSFLKQNGDAASCTIEKPEHALVEKYVKPGMAVLELGARYGTTTCAIAAQLQNSGKLVAVEPDQVVWSALGQNLRSHDCKATVLQGVVGTQERHMVTPSGYGGRTSLVQQTVPATSFATLEKELGQPFDAVMIDCEGCVETFFAENPTALEHTKVIMIEGDMGVYDEHFAPDCGDRCVNYNAVINNLISHGYELLEANTDPTSCCPWIHHFALNKIA